MRAGNNFNIARPVQNFQTTSESSSTPPVKRARTEIGSPESPLVKRAKTEDRQQPSSSATNPFSYAEKSKRFALMKQIQEKKGSHSTTEIQEESDSHLTPEGASPGRVLVQSLEMQRIGGLTTSSSSGSSSEQALLGLRRRTHPITLDDLPNSREILLSSKNPAACMLGAALNNIHTQFENETISPNEHWDQCQHVLNVADMLYGLSDINEHILQDLNLNGMTLENNRLTEEEFSIIVKDVELQLDPDHGIAAALDRNTQNARAANRHRRALQNMTKVDPSLAQIITKGIYHACDAAASSLSYSAAALSNSSLYRRSMVSGAAWSTSAVFSGINRSLSAQDRTFVGLLSDAVDFGAGIASMAATGLSYASNPSQKAINYAASVSNVLWASGGMLSSTATIQQTRRMANQYGMSALAYAATGFDLAEDWANIAAATVGIASTATSNGSNITLNKLSAGLWMAGTVFGTASTVLYKMHDNRQREMNRPTTQ